MKANKISIIGAGNMGTALIEGLLKSELYKGSQLCVTDKSAARLSEMELLNIKTTTNSCECIHQADIIIIVVKPAIVKEVCKEIAESIDLKKQLIISIAAGVSSDDIRKHLGNEAPVILAMPNTAIALCQSITCLSGKNVSKEWLKLTESIFNKLGETFIVEEDQMSACTVLASCGTAFALRFIRAAMLGGIEIGFKPDVAKRIAAQMAKGAAEIILQNNSNPEDEIDKVSTPKGITITGLNEMEHQGFSSSILKGILKSYEKIEGLKKK